MKHYAGKEHNTHSLYSNRGEIVSLQRLFILAIIFPNINHIFQSTVLPVNINLAWDAIKNLQLDIIAPDMVSSVAYVSGGEGQVGSQVSISYKSGDVWKLRITEYSERSYTVAYDITETDPAISVTSVSAEFNLFEVTDDDTTYLKWTTTYSNDVDAQIISDQKYKKCDFFNAWKNSLKA